METIIHPPRTLLEVYESLPEGTLCQLINNQLIMSPALKDIHQKVLDTVYRRLGDFVERNTLGETRVAPYDVYFDTKNVYQPDSTFIANENTNGIKENGFHGAPDLIIEILSPATARYDLEDKKDVYERYGVKEYWIVDPATKEVKGYTLQNGGYAETFSAYGTIQSLLLDCTIRF